MKTTKAVCGIDAITRSVVGSVSATCILPLLLLLAVPAQDYLCRTNNGAITIFKYIGSGGAVDIPSEIDGLPVTSIEDAFYNDTSLTSVTIPGSVTNIIDEAFYDCTGLTNVTIGDGVISIAIAAFGECSGLTSLAIPASVTNIADEAFFGCVSLTAITVAGSNPAYMSEGGVLFDIGQTTLIACPPGQTGSYAIPDSVTRLSAGAFWSCFGLTNVTIPAGVMDIGSNVFCECTGLASITLPDEVTNIDSWAFRGCTNLATVTIPDSVATIGPDAFADCSSLTNVTVGGSVASIQSYAFGNNRSLKGAYFKGNAPVADTSTFLSDSEATAYYLPGTTGWGATFGGLPTVLWNPQVQTSGASFGARTDHFGFNITGGSNLVVVVEACTNLAHPTWSRLQTNTLSGASLYFSDPQWTHYGSRFYRLTMP